MAANIDISSLTPAQLDELIQKAAAQKAAVAKQHRDDVKKKLAQLAKDEGYSIEELFGSKRPGRSTGSAARFANPADPSQTWVGRGKRPQWFKDALGAGKTPESMRI